MTSRWRGLGAALVVGAAWMTLAGCELIAKPDRSLITAGVGGAGQGGSGGAGGSGGGCSTPADCPTPAQECKVATCDSGVCGEDDAPAGTPSGTQTDGDCKLRSCDGTGPVEVDDDTDVPVDQNDCTDDVCAAGVPSNPPLGSGTPCGADLVCDGSGSCVGCVTPDDCPGQDTECQARTCDASGVCGLSFTAAGTVLQAQTDGDCKEAQCDGNGGVTDVDDDADLPDDGLECTDDVCAAGAPSNPPLASGTGCTQGGGQFCNGAGACVECVSASTCPGQDTECQTRTCVLGACGIAFTAAGTPVASQASGDCQVNQCDGAGAVVSAPDDADVPVDGNPCTSDVCTAGAPSNPPTASGVGCNQGGGQFCDGAGACVECVSASTCPGQDTECQARTCAANACGFSYTAAGFVVSTQAPGDCQVNQCDGAGAVVSVADDADVPADANQCTDDICVAGVPSNPDTAAGASCDQSGGHYCDGAGSCVECLDAATCPGQDTECQQRTCISNACGVGFTAAGTPVSSQTAGDCHRNECDGAGAETNAIDDNDVPVDGNECTDDVCSAGAGSNPNTPAGAPCSQSNGSVCDGSGACVPVILASASPQVIAHGGRVTLTGFGFTGAASVTIGGATQAFTVDSDTQITVGPVADATPLAAQDVVVTKPNGSSPPVSATVIHLVINELDSDTPAADVLEFIEISTGVPGVSLAAYTLVFWNGATDVSYRAIGLNGAADANGLLLVGNAGVTPAPAVTFPNDTLQNGQDAVGIYQALPAAFPNNTAVTANGLIDALVYSTADATDGALLDTLISSSLVNPARVQVDEGANPTSESQSIQRCGAPRRNGSKFAVGNPPTPGAANNVAPCPP
ncbi:MAG: hypothetical protein IT372_21870 [Polyangiaceae bacterium]|nr:hypothetical protein [Polyangiaceae bacterium]